VGCTTTTVLREVDDSECYCQMNSSVASHSRRQISLRATLSFASLTIQPRTNTHMHMHSPTARMCAQIWVTWEMVMWEWSKIH
jgi:hypothetical protein